MAFPLRIIRKNRVSAACVCALLAGLIFAGQAMASLARTMSLEQICKSAEIIADVTVQNVQSYWATPAGTKAIRTRVSFLVLKSIKGNPGGSLTLDFLGGEIDGRGLKVPDVPQFSPGERYILFCAGPGKALVCPVLGLTQGAMRVVHDNESNVDRVYRHWGQPVNGTEKFETRVPAMTGVTTRDYLRSADTVDQFLERVRQAASQ
ncbi:MAG: hypothetical protein JO015_07950 [Verrucomicrobia bacterium]|nr:hypothetical protein [Verrucomicrobiota bacterium]